MVDIGDYSSIYHLHIPRTSGVFIRSHLSACFKDRVNFVNHYNRISPKTFNDSYLVAGHFGLSPIEHMQNPFIFSIVREPIERFISYFRYVSPTLGMSDQPSHFDRWINDPDFYPYHENSQTRFLSNKIDISQYNEHIGDGTRIIKNWFIEKSDNDLSNAKSFIDNHIVFTMDNIGSLYSNLSSLLNVRDFTHTYKMNTSSELGFDITPSQYDRILELNALDLEVYDYARKKEKEYNLGNSRGI